MTELWVFEDVWSQTRHQRCWFHKSGNVWNKFSNSLQSKAKTDLHNIWMAENREEASKSFALLLDKYEKKYSQATEYLAKERAELLAFYDFPTEYWKHIRTTNPIESTFATLRNRIKCSKGRLARKTAFIMVFKLIKNAEKSWRKIDGKISCQRSF